jgi:HD domain
LQLHDLPDDAIQLLTTLNAPPRLIAHLTLVHDAAFEILDGLQRCWPALKIDRDAVMFGAATHDAGKCLHHNELTGPGNRHEQDGPGLLEQYGVSPERSRFARTHGAWNQEPDLALEDFVVALADHSWKGSRNEVLESKIAEQIARSVGIETWEAFMKLDEIVAEVASHSEERLASQGRASI